MNKQIPRKTELTNTGINTNRKYDQLQKLLKKLKL